MIYHIALLINNIYIYIYIYILYYILYVSILKCKPLGSSIVLTFPQFLRDWQTPSLSA